jgi:ABC-2 type transport system ATP-binding protein
MAVSMLSLPAFLKVQNLLIGYEADKLAHYQSTGDRMVMTSVSASVLLNVQQVSKSYGTRLAVDGVSFQVRQGQTVGLIGPNGAGKSTTVAMICGLLRPDSGEITLDGEAIAQGAGAAKLKIGFVPQDLALYDELSALENLKLFGALYGLKGALLKQRCEQALALVNLADRAADKPSTFSGGMKRRLNIAAALLHDPRLLILDEPTVGVDPQSRNAIFDTLETLKAQGRSLIYTSHYMEEVERLADHIVIIDHGKVLADETPAALYQRLPAQAALQAELARAPDAALLSGAQELPGVTAVAHDGVKLDISLVSAVHAPLVLTWLAAQCARSGNALLHFATAKTSLEDIFLNLTGRSLRD